MFTHTRTHTHRICINSVDCISANFLVVTLYYTYELLPLGKLGKGYTGSLCMTSYKCM